MVALDHGFRHSLPAMHAGRLAEVNELGQRVEYYFHRHPKVLREAFLLDALRHELVAREGAELRRREMAVGGAEQLKQTAENVDRSAMLAARLAALNYERHGMWPRLRRYFSRARPAS